MLCERMPDFFAYLFSFLKTLNVPYKKKTNQNTNKKGIFPRLVNFWSPIQLSEERADLMARASFSEIPAIA
jgi:hypothetical protein